MRCESVELQQTDSALRHDVNDLGVTADHGHILIVLGLISSYHAPLAEHDFRQNHTKIKVDILSFVVEVIFSCSCFCVFVLLQRRHS